MDQPPNSIGNPPPPPSSLAPLHQSDADADDDTIKQLQECSYIYLSLQDCLVNTNRNWKSCQLEEEVVLDVFTGTGTGTGAGTPNQLFFGATQHFVGSILEVRIDFHNQPSESGFSALESAFYRLIAVGVISC